MWLSLHKSVDLASFETALITAISLSKDVERKESAADLKVVRRAVYFVLILNLLFACFSWYKKDLDSEWEVVLNYRRQVRWRMAHKVNPGYVQTVCINNLHQC